ncbi:hypothetical protein [Methanobrevibacter sp.]|uniref:hypothetical protein n=1 Tax=Methanobrevibacter sp. TaxID=66852 RepID=UPI0038630D88
MSLLLALFSVGLTAKMLADVGKEVTRVPSRSNIAEASKQGNFDVVDNFFDIITACGVKKKKFNSSVAVLEPFGYKKCLPLIRDHHLTTKEDEQRFIAYYEKVMTDQINQRQEEYDQRYFKVKAEAESLMNSGDDYEIVKFEHLDVLVDSDYVNQKVDQIYNNTFFGNLTIKEPKVKVNSSGNSYTEIWALKIPTSMRLSLKMYYRCCSERCGYIEP